MNVVTISEGEAAAVGAVEDVRATATFAEMTRAMRDVY